MKANCKNQPSDEWAKDKGGWRGAVAFVCVVIACVAICFWALPCLPITPPTQSLARYKGVIELWNVECFEGGCGSRQSWLTSKSAVYEKQNQGLFVHVTTLSAQQMSQKLADGDNFDMITFCRGVGCQLLPSLAPFTFEPKDVLPNMLVAGQVKGVQYALPLYSGIYCLIARASQLNGVTLPQNVFDCHFTRKVGKNTFELTSLVCGFAPYASPLTALATSGAKGDATKLDASLSQYDAYEQFVGNKRAVTLLGSQRDVYRLQQKEQNGKIEQLTYQPLSSYVDLVQYVGVSNNCGQKQDACFDYVKYLLSQRVQSTLVDLRLFGVTSNQTYTQRLYQQCQQALGECYVPNVFATQQAIENQRATAVTSLAQ